MVLLDKAVRDLASFLLLLGPGLRCILSLHSRAQGYQLHALCSSTKGGHDNEEGRHFLCENSGITSVPESLVRAQSRGHTHLQRDLGDGVPAAES